jgi:hypothetical protein
VPSHVAEGKGRHSDKEFAHFLCNARGSLLELETQLILAERLEYLSAAEGKRLAALAECVGRALSGLIILCVAFQGTMPPKRLQKRKAVIRQRPKANDQRPCS